MKKPKTVYELFKDHPERWTKGWFAKDKDGTFTSVDDKGAVCWCLSGALRKVYGMGIRSTRIWQRIASFLPRQEAISYWNDKKGRTFKQVLALVKKAGV